MDAKYQVTVNCCTHGNCDACAGVTPYGKPTRRLHTKNISKEHADRIAKNWQAYAPIVSEMKPESN